MIPREGANTFKGVVFGNYTNGQLQSNNLSDALIANGLTAVNSVDKIWDFNPGVGGPILRDKLWFYLSARDWGTNTLVAGNFFNATPGGNPPVYTPDRSRQATYPADARRLQRAAQLAGDASQQSHRRTIRSSGRSTSTTSIKHWTIRMSR